jgi:hypothetical protein
MNQAKCALHAAPRAGRRRLTTWKKSRRSGQLAGKNDSRGRRKIRARPASRENESARRQRNGAFACTCARREIRIRAKIARALEW